MRCRSADQLKNDFVQHVSYELRSPLTNIIGFTELLQLPASGPLTPRQREYVDHIGSSSSVLLTIVNDILDLATVDAGIMELDIARGQRRADHRRRRRLVADRLQRAFASALRDRRVARAEELPWRRAPRPPDPVQPAEQRRQLRAGRQHDHAGLPRSRWRRRILACTTTGRACRRKCSTRVFRRFEPRQWRPPARRRPRPVDRQELRRAARRHGPIDTARTRARRSSACFPIGPAGVQRRGGVAC